MYKKIELLANVAIIVVALALAAVLTRQYLWPGPEPKTAPAQSAIRPGTKITLPGAAWEGNGRTLLLVLQKGCGFCTTSAPFYQRLVKEAAGRGDVRLVAVLPQGEDEGREYLKGLGVEIDDVRQASPSALGARGTPTLILVDSAGLVTDSWVGKLPPDREAEVLRRLGA